MPVMAMLAISRVEAPALASITICASDVTPPLLATLFVTKFGWDKLFDLFVFFTLISGAICTIGARFTTLNPRWPNRSVLEPSEFPL